MSTHDDDEVVIQANKYLHENWQPGEHANSDETNLIYEMLNRIGEKKVEIRGLEGQVSTLKKREDELESAFIHHYEDGGCDPRYQDLYERVAHSIVLKLETKNES